MQRPGKTHRASVSRVELLATRGRQLRACLSLDRAAALNLRNAVFNSVGIHQLAHHALEQLEVVDRILRSLERRTTAVDSAICLKRPHYHLSRLVLFDLDEQAFHFRDLKPVQRRLCGLVLSERPCVFSCEHVFLPLSVGRFRPPISRVCDCPYPSVVHNRRFSRIRAHAYGRNA